MKRAAHFFSIAILLAGGAPGPAVYAHKFHASLSQIEYNGQQRAVEITVRMFADDLEQMLTRRAGKSVRLDKTPDVDSLILAYLREALELKDREGTIRPLSWVGKETQVDTVWAYVEAKMPEGLAGAALRNRIFFELFDDQVNRVSIKQEARRSDLVFKPGDGFKEIMFKR